MTPAHRPRGLLGFLTLTVAIGLVALVLSVQNAVAIDDQAEQRELERIAQDVASCERGNVLRQQIIDGLQANDDLVSGILDTFFGPAEQDPERAERIRMLRAELGPAFADYRAITSEIQLVNCRTAIKGAGALDRS